MSRLSIWQSSGDLMIHGRREHGALLCVNGWNANNYNFDVGLWPLLLKGT